VTLVTHYQPITEKKEETEDVQKYSGYYGYKNWHVANIRQ
jgi:hypothetical protein